MTCAADLYKQASSLYTVDTYIRMLSAVNALARSPLNNSDNTTVQVFSLPQVLDLMLSVFRDSNMPSAGRYSIGAAHCT